VPALTHGSQAGKESAVSPSLAQAFQQGCRRLNKKRA
jgi:hypothetical protein